MSTEGGKNLDVSFKTSFANVKLELTAADPLLGDFLDEEPFNFPLAFMSARYLSARASPEFFA